MTDTDHIRVIVREELNGKVMYRDTCEQRHNGMDKEIETVKEKIRTLDGRFWAIIMLILAQMAILVFK